MVLLYWCPFREGVWRKEKFSERASRPRPSPVFSLVI
jgi:hypothetical protein